MSILTRRKFLTGVAGAAMIVAASKTMAFDFLKKAKAHKGEHPFQLSRAEWKEKLTPEQFRVLRDHGTERSGTSPLNKEKRDGTYHCAGCDHPLFSSEHKFESGTGWPSFFAPVNEKSLGFSSDNILFYTRTEEHCANCGGHLGHVFDDGPQPTGKRHCINGVAMVFKPST